MIQIEGVDTIVADFGEAETQVTKALVRALNRSIGSGRTVMVRAIAQDTGLKSRDVRDAMVLREATMSRPEASIGTTLKRIPLIKFGAKGPEPSRGRGRGVTAKLPGGAGRYPNAFIATMKSGHRGVFTRIGAGARKSAGAWRANLPIAELHGPSLGQVFSKHRPIGVARVLEAFDANFDHELDFLGKSTGAAGSD